jgi:hypothetical protein
MNVDITSTSHPIRRGLITTAAAMSVGLLTAPLANWYWQSTGLIVLAVFALCMLAAIWIVLAVEWRLARMGHQVASTMAGMLVRLVLPMSVCLAIVLMADDAATKNSVLLCVPMYVTMLAVDTFLAISAIPKSPCHLDRSPIQVASCSGVK